MKTRLNHRTQIIIKTTVAGVVLAVVFYAGTFVGQAALEPQAKANINTAFNPTVETRLVETRTTQYVETPAVTANTNEQVKVVEPANNTVTALRNFKDVQELKQWLENRNNTTTVFFRYPDTTIDCDDFALTLQQNALADGYLMNFQIIEAGKYNTLFQNTKIPAGTMHAVNLVIIGNNVFYIEPQTGEIAIAAMVD